MLMMKERRAAIRTLQGWAISVLLDAYATENAKNTAGWIDRALVHEDENG
jgi:hypothetical protein